MLAFGFVGFPCFCFLLYFLLLLLPISSFHVLVLVYVVVGFPDLLWFRAFVFKKNASRWGKFDAFQGSWG